MPVIPLGAIPRHHAQRKPDEAVAVVYPDGSLTWWELERRSSQRARLFASKGVRSGDFVTLAARNSILFYEASFAIWKLGAIPNVVSPSLPQSELRAIVELVGPRLVVGDVEVPGFPQVRFDVDAGAFDDGPVDSPVAACWKAMTSGGSTGRPKVIVDHRPSEIEADAAQSFLHQYLLMKPDSAVLNPGPLHHNGPFLFTHLALFAGSKVVGLQRFDAEEALRLIEHHRIRWVCLVPTMMHRIWSLPEDLRSRYDVSSLESLWHMAASCPVWLKQNWLDWLGAEKVWEMYGGTEAIGGALITGPEWLGHRGSVGRAAPGSKFKILREDGTECAIGEVGEIYFCPPELPTSHYIGAEPKKDTSGWQSLGDMGHLDGEGYLYIADRRADLILRGGANIYPAEIEAALDSHPGVGSSVVIGLPCEELGSRVHAIVQPRPGEAPAPEQIHAFLLQRLEKYKLPESYEFVGEPLRDDAGKVRRSALRSERIQWLSQQRPFKQRPG